MMHRLLSTLALLCSISSMCAHHLNDSVRTLSEVSISAGATRNLYSPQMGMLTLEADRIQKLPTLFGEPDLVKVLQTQAGVSQGVEGFSGLYVRGGNNDENLFIYNGLPLYHVTHLGGIFSSFNVATISEVNFYKSAFPSQFGGRLSSIVDIKMKRPEFQKYTGSFSLGLLTGNAYISGPLVKNRTAFSLALRRSWIDLAAKPMLAIINSSQKKHGKKQIADYAFTDFNFRLEHRFSPRVTSYLLGYYGQDRLKFGQREFNSSEETYREVNGKLVRVERPENEVKFFDEKTNRLNWGNWGVLGNTDIRLAAGLLSASLSYSQYDSFYAQEREAQADLNNPKTYLWNYNETRNKVGSLSAKLTYIGSYGKGQLLKAGVGYVRHHYQPEQIVNTWQSYKDTTHLNNNSGSIHADELYAYVDNTLEFGSLALNLGLRGSYYGAKGQSQFMWEPRAAARLMIDKNYSIKASFSRVHQVLGQVSNNYVNLPTDLWLPVIAPFRPLSSNQFALGFFGNTSARSYFSVEGWYKQMNHLLEYKEGSSILNPNVNWYDKLTAGRGWAYGIDLTYTRGVGKLTGSVAYGLMWNKRNFKELNLGRDFPAKFDNRHKLNISANYELKPNVELNAEWMYMTGNRLTLSLYNYEVADGLFGGAPQIVGEGLEQSTGMNYFADRNNVRLPAFHRLNVGITFRKHYRNGAKGAWNVGLYNAYSRMNPMSIQKDKESNIGLVDKANWRRQFKTISLIPILPSVSYTYQF